MVDLISWRLLILLETVSPRNLVASQIIIKDTGEIIQLIKLFIAWDKNDEI